MTQKSGKKIWKYNGHDFVSGLTQSEKTSLFEIGVYHKFQKNKLVFCAGSPCDDLFILLKGRVKIYELSSIGKEVILWFCFPGEIFGLAEVMSRRRWEKRQVSAEACSPVELLSINHKDFTDFLYQNPEVALRVIDLLSFRMRELGDMLLNIVSDDVTSRVIKLLIRLATRYGRDNGPGIHLDIPLTHQDMADMIGTSRQTVSMVLGNLKKEDLIKTGQRTIFIQNYADLRNRLFRNNQLPNNYKNQSLQMYAGLS